MPDDSLNIHEAVQILKVNKLKANFASSQDGAKGTRFTFPTKTVSYTHLTLPTTT